MDSQYQEGFEASINNQRLEAISTLITFFNMKFIQIHYYLSFAQLYYLILIHCYFKFNLLSCLCLYSSFIMWQCCRLCFYRFAFFIIEKISKK